MVNKGLATGKHGVADSASDEWTAGNWKWTEMVEIGGGSSGEIGHGGGLGGENGGGGGGRNSGWLNV